jgi:hypothetical protein
MLPERRPSKPRLPAKPRNSAAAERKGDGLHSPPGLEREHRNELVTVPKAKRSVIAVCYGRSEDTLTKRQKQIVKDAYKRGVVLRLPLANFSYTGTNRPDKRSVH